MVCELLVFPGSPRGLFTVQVLPNEFLINMPKESAENAVPIYPKLHRV
jgi:hypothetical protein